MAQPNQGYDEMVLKFLTQLGNFGGILGFLYLLVKAGGSFMLDSGGSMKDLSKDIQLLTKEVNETVILLREVVHNTKTLDQHTFILNNISQHTEATKTEILRMNGNFDSVKDLIKFNESSTSKRFDTLERKIDQLLGPGILLGISERKREKQPKKHAEITNLEEDSSLSTKPEPDAQGSSGDEGA